MLLFSFLFSLSSFFYDVLGTGKGIALVESACLSVLPICLRSLAIFKRLWAMHISANSPLTFVSRLK